VPVYLVKEIMAESPAAMAAAEEAVREALVGQVDCIVMALMVQVDWALISILAANL
jgi:hypothetical protein